MELSLVKITECIFATLSSYILPCNKDYKRN